MVFDLHLHSLYSFATSKRMVLSEITENAKRKGIDMIGVSDILHREWILEAGKLLKDNGNGIYNYNGMKIILAGEISFIYKDKGKTRKIHLVIGVENFDKLSKLREFASKYGKLESDGRPILKLDIKDFTEELLQIENNPIIIAAHIWTPWYGLLGSKSGYNSVKEAFGHYTEYITALETGLSSDIYMNSMVGEVASYPLVSFSDAHSPETIGREVSVFTKMPTSFHDIVNKIKDRSIITGEVYPQHGKYFVSGHRKCDYKLEPYDLKKECPVCNKPLTQGVSDRVAELADSKGNNPVQEFFYMVSLKELLKINRKLKKVFIDINAIDIFYRMSDNDLYDKFPEDMANKIIKIREGKVHWISGYDGVYGKMEV